MQYEMKRSRFEGEWVVEAIGMDGEVNVAAFSGPNAQELAAEYAAWKNNLDRHQVTV